MRIATVSAVAGSLLALAGCSSEKMAGSPPSEDPQVGYVVLSVEPVENTTESVRSHQAVGVEGVWPPGFDGGLVLYRLIGPKDVKRAIVQPAFANGRPALQPNDGVFVHGNGPFASVVAAPIGPTPAPFIRTDRPSGPGALVKVMRAEEAGDKIQVAYLDIDGARVKELVVSKSGQLTVDYFRSTSFACIYGSGASAKIYPHWSNQLKCG
ncbi:hypothetical protein VC279_11735 [Xanthomonas sp. WHRI 10064A]|uniref:hypothetical protein n=1 Tax=unclassified Xanthomonas TaxID=2643310 RepID=UPI002B22CAC5|nr:MULTISPECIES: hypothetical protein [unclassified Xanthomonas]MEA9587635.1 hypothetical protein [Xanthomonas sp. WHRI 10064B]MEA9615357.1 hypothetical protein [Xanthomonas sp. WHRI 10064A]